MKYISVWNSELYSSLRLHSHAINKTEKSLSLNTIRKFEKKYDLHTSVIEFAIELPTIYLHFFCHFAMNYLLVMGPSRSSARFGSPCLSKSSTRPDISCKKARYSSACSMIKKTQLTLKATLCHDTIQNKYLQSKSILVIEIGNHSKILVKSPKE